MEEEILKYLKPDNKDRGEVVEKTLRLWKDQIDTLNQVAEYLTKQKENQDIKNKVPPSKRGRKVSHAQAARFLLDVGKKWCGVPFNNNP